MLSGKWSAALAEAAGKKGSFHHNNTDDDLYPPSTYHLELLTGGLGFIFLIINVKTHLSARPRLRL